MSNNEISKTLKELYELRAMRTELEDEMMWKAGPLHGLNALLALPGRVSCSSCLSSGLASSSVMLRDEAGPRHGKAFKGLLKRYFGK